MIKETYEPQTVVQNVKVLETCTCDVCGKKIFIFRPNHSPRYAQYYYVTTGHHDWGNDSVDSMNNYEACSPECVNELVNLYYKRSHAGDTQSRHNSEYIIIENKYHFTSEDEE